MSEPRDTKTLKKIDLPVTGMTCAACAGAIERGLGKIEGVEAVAVNLPAEKATITFSRKDVVPLRKIVDTIREEGYGVATARIDLTVRGMTCAACVNAVEKALTALEGVESTTVNLAAERASVRYIPTLVGIEDFRRAIADAGYAAEILTEEIVDQEREARFRASGLGHCGRSISLTRVEVPQVASPSQYEGSWAGDLAPNTRVPLYDLDGYQRRVLLAYVGRSWQQEAMAAPRIMLDAAPGQGQTAGYSVFVPGYADPSKLQAFARALPNGHNIQYAETANGVLIHVLPHLETGQAPEEAAIHAAGEAAGFVDATLHSHAYENTLVFADQYDGIIKEFEDARRDTRGDEGAVSAYPNKTL